MSTQELFTPLITPLIFEHPKITNHDVHGICLELSWKKNKANPPRHHQARPDLYGCRQCQWYHNGGSDSVSDNRQEQTRQGISKRKGVKNLHALPLICAAVLFFETEAQS